MKVSIIGAGNMGSAIAKGLVLGSKIKPEDLTVSDIFQKPLDDLKAFNSKINLNLDSYESVKTADIIILAVKPWLISDVILDIKFMMDYGKQILISIAAGISTEEIEKTLTKSSDPNTLPVIFRVVPNTAIAVRKSMTLMTSRNATSEQEELIVSLFDELGKAIHVDENIISPGTALASCGIAYLFRYVRAAMLAGTEMGFYPKQAQEIIVETMLGAAELLKETGANPEEEIDKVTTPGGITIKGLNELEANGFSNAIIKAIKASNR